MRRQLAIVLSLGLLAAALSPRLVAAQLLDVHGIGSVETEKQSTSWGGGLGVGTVFVPVGFAVIGFGVGADYMREQHLGKSLVTTSLDATLSSTSSNRPFLPYIGGSVGLNWSGGQYAQWNGARFGLDGIVGVKALFGSEERLGWKLEERFGYVRGFQHAYATRLGLLFGL